MGGIADCTDTSRQGRSGHNIRWRKGNSDLVEQALGWSTWAQSKGRGDSSYQWQGDSVPNCIEGPQNGVYASGIKMVSIMQGRTI